MKLHYVRYSEGRADLLVSSGPVMVVSMSFSAGCLIAKNAGHQTKALAMKRVAEVNQSAGKEIASYAGRFEAPKSYDGAYQLQEAQ